MGCIEFNSYKKALQSLVALPFTYPQHMFRLEKIRKSILIKTFQKRADFFKKYLPVIKKIPAYRFTSARWKYFDELDRKD
jgi:hypothetical protein